LVKISVICVLLFFRLLYSLDEKTQGNRFVCGHWGVRLGLEKAGFEVSYSNDIDKYCEQTFNANFPDKLDRRDIRLINPKNS